MDRYNLFLQCLYLSAVVADVQNGKQLAAGAVAHILSSPGSNPLPAIVNTSTLPVDVMVTDYVAYIWENAPKPEWLTNAGL